MENLSENSYGLSKDPQITKTILKKSRSGGLTLFYLKTYYKVNSNQNSMYGIGIDTDI